MRELARRRDERLVLHRCERCGHELLDPQPSDSWLDEIYGGYDVIRGNHPKRRFFEKLLDSCGLDLEGARVLELGGAEGDCASVLVEGWSGVSVTVVEPHLGTAEHYAALGATLERASIEEWLRRPCPEPFDFVIALDCLEHLRDPVACVVEIAANHLAAEGHLLATFPNADALSRRTLGAQWMQYKPEHLHYFSRSSVKRLAERCGLETRRLAPLVKRLPLDYLTSVGARSGPPGLRAVARLLESALPAGLARWHPPLPLGEWVWLARKGPEMLER